MSDVATIEKTESQLDKSAIRDFAVNARRKLKEKVELQANKMGFYSDNRPVQYEFEDDKQFKINGETFNKSQANILKREIQDKGFETVVDEVAYTWFNRFIALYYMERHNYIENGLNVVSSIDDLNQTAMKATNCFKNLNKESLFNAIQNNDSDGIYRTLIMAQCNELNNKLPFLFEKISDYTELLFPSGMMNNDSVIREMLTLDKKNWEQVEIIGWLYQFYITEVNELVYDGNMSKKRLPKELLPAATQLFTPKWAVQYMVANSVGKLWLENKPNADLQKKFKYYLESIETSENNRISIIPENIKVLDPACGSGHILVTAFEMLYEIYKSAGYLEDEIAALILKNNLFGLDICDRAAQLAQLAVIMKAREYDKKISDKVKELNITSIQESNWIDERVKECLMNGAENKLLATSQIELLIDTFKDAKEYGSILKVKDFDFNFWEERLNAVQTLNMGLLYLDVVGELQQKLPVLIRQAKIMQQKYECVITNPPYLGAARMSSKLVEYITKYFPDEKSDFCTTFYKKSLNDYLAKDGYLSFIMTNSWLFLKSFEKLREYVINNFEFESLVDFGTELFDGKVGHNPIAAWVNKKTLPTKKLLAVRLVDYCYSRRNEKPIEFFNKQNYYVSDQKEFSYIPCMPIAYWASDKIKQIFKNEKSLSNIASPKQGMATSDNNRFLRFWNEVEFSHIGLNYESREQALQSKLKWFPYNKGGAYRKWYGNNENVVNWSNDGYEIINSVDENGKQLSRPQNTQFFFKKCISWSKISSSDLSMRFFDNGFLFDVAGCSIFTDSEKELKYILGFVNSSVVKTIIKSISATLNYEVGQISSLPLITNIDDTLKNTIIEKVNKCIAISKEDWDCFETSWDFKLHPLLRFSNFNNGLVDYKNINESKPYTLDGYKIKHCFEEWKKHKEEQYKQLKETETELNRLFIEIYGLQDEMKPDVSDDDLSYFRLADEKREIKSLLSYAVGCMLGRYSLDEEGLVFAGGTFDPYKYTKLEVDEDGILPILSDTWFEDDIIEELKRFLKAAFGEICLSENMEYIADVLGRKNGESAENTIRNYFLKDFYKDHLQVYKKRPIYWLFTSGKEKAFNCLVYLHRYDKTTLSRIRKDYLHEFQAKLDRAIAQADDEGNVNLTSLYAKYRSELLDYDAKIKDLADSQIELDLDDGVKVNYAKFKGLLEAEKDIVGKN